jgi:thiamine biosynthesis lipoprotein
MGTTVSITAHGEDRAHLMAATTRAFSELTRMDRLLSVYRNTSEISALNRTAGREPARVSDATGEILRRAKQFSALTEGTFDNTVEPLMNLWGFRTEGSVRSWPTDKELADAQEGVGWWRVEVSDDGWAMLSHRRSQVDLGGIGVGYTVDRMGEILRREGVSSALINHSGDILAIGAPPDTDGWPVAVPDPVDPYQLLVQLTLRDRAISTSSNRRSTRILQHATVGHILDPRTGKNPEGVLSVSVVAPTSTEADALSTALFVDRSRSAIWRSQQRELIVITDQGRERAVQWLR